MLDQIAFMSKIDVMVLFPAIAIMIINDCKCQNECNRDIRFTYGKSSNIYHLLSFPIMIKIGILTMPKWISWL